MKKLDADALRRHPEITHHLLQALYDGCKMLGVVTSVGRAGSNDIDENGLVQGAFGLQNLEHKRRYTVIPVCKGYLIHEIGSHIRMQAYSACATLELGCPGCT